MSEGRSKRYSTILTNNSTSVVNFVYEYRRKIKVKVIPALGSIDAGKDFARYKYNTYFHKKIKSGEINASK